MSQMNKKILMLNSKGVKHMVCRIDPAPIWLAFGPQTTGWGILPPPGLQLCYSSLNHMFCLHS